MSTSTPKRKGNVQFKSQSYPGTPQTEKLRVNLSEAFNNFDNDVTLTTPTQDTVYETALEQNSSSPQEKTLNTSIKSYERVNEFTDEMEKLRDQLHTMLNPQEHILEESPDLLNISSSSSIDTIALLKSALPHSSPELELDENGVLLSTNSNRYSRNGWSYQTATTVLDSSLAAENMILKENIEKERYRRKHCEDIIQELQNKLLESQEQLAVAHATEKKKEIMIEQLDRTLANVVEGWKQQDHSKIVLINQLQDEKENLEIQHQNHEKVLEKFEDDLSEAVKAAQIEQEKKLKTESQLREMQDECEQKIISHTKEIDELKKANHFLKEENGQLVYVNDEITGEKDALMRTYEEKQTEWQLKHEELNEEVALLKHETKNTINELQTLVEACHKELESAQASLSSKENSIKRLQMELEATLIEKDRLSMEISLVQSKLEAVQTKKDSEMRAKLEEEFNSQIYEIQKQISITENELRQSQKKQMNELNRKHQEEMEKQKQRFQNDIKKKEGHYLQQVNEFKDRLQHAENEISELAGSNKILQQQRGELMDRMKNMMQQHWQETVSLLDTEKTPVASLYAQHQPPEQLSSTLRNDYFTSSTNPFLPDYIENDRIFPVHSKPEAGKYEQNPQMQYASTEESLYTAQNNNSYERFMLAAHQNELSKHNTSASTGVHSAELFIKPNSSLGTKLIDPRIRPPVDNSHFTVESDKMYGYMMNGQKESIRRFAEPAPNQHHMHSYEKTVRDSIPRTGAKHPVPFDERVTSSVSQQRFVQNQPPQFPQSSAGLFNEMNVRDDQKPHDKEQSLRSLDLSRSSKTVEYEANEVYRHKPEYLQSNAMHMSNQQAEMYKQESRYNYQNMNRPIEFQVHNGPNHKQSAAHPNRRNEILTNSKFDLHQSINNDHVAHPLVDQEDPISLLYQDLESTNDETVMHATLEEKLGMQEEKQGRLSHFIEKLLQRSPGQPLEETQDDISLNVDRLLENTTPPKQPVNHTAFKKSVIRQPNQNTSRRRNSSKPNLSNSSDQLLTSPEKKRQHLVEHDQLMQLRILLDSKEKFDDVSILKMINKLKKSKEQNPVSSTNQTNHEPNLMKSTISSEANLMKSTISSVAKHHASRKSSKPTNVNKNVASKEQRRLLIKQYTGKPHSAWK